jgi:ferrous iron transport protein B
VLDKLSAPAQPRQAAVWRTPTAADIAHDQNEALATVKRETNSWRYPIIMAAYLFGLAYAGSWITYHVASALTG